MSKVRVHRALALMIVGLVITDWTSKLWITNRLALGDTEALVDGWLYFVHRHNPGVAFSLLAELPDVVRVPLLTLLGALGIYLFARLLLTTGDRATQFGAAAVIAGALGNMGDRLFDGGVTDFLFVARFPFVFNVADAAITVGGSLLAIRLLTGDGMPAPPADTAGPNPA